MNFIIVTLILSSLVYLAWSMMSIARPKTPWKTLGVVFKQRLTKPYPKYEGRHFPKIDLFEGEFPKDSPTFCVGFA